MSHGNVTVAVGECPVCRRRNVELAEYIAADESRRRACTDEFACCDNLARSAPDDEDGQL